MTTFRERKTSRQQTKVEPPVKGMKKIPMGLPLMFDAWFACVLWAGKNEAARVVFETETGLSLANLLKDSPLDAAIDRATGFDQHVLAAFCDYVTVTFWGEERPTPTKPWK